jgi:hypothetical protein
MEIKCVKRPQPQLDWDCDGFAIADAIRGSSTALAPLWIAKAIWWRLDAFAHPNFTSFARLRGDRWRSQHPGQEGVSFLRAAIFQPGRPNIDRAAVDGGSPKEPLLKGLDSMMFASCVRD